MKKRWVLGMALVSMLAFFTANAYPWGAAVHVYIAFKLKGPDPNVMYAAIAPDCFNYAFVIGIDPALSATLYDKFHNNPEVLWTEAGTDPIKRALAYGFMSHGHKNPPSYLGGADYTAHFGGSQFGKKEGYVIAKAEVLDNILASTFPEYAMLKTYDPEKSLEVAHNLVENAIDVLIKRVDPEIGLKMQIAVCDRDGGFPPFLDSTFSSLAGTPFGLIMNIENDFFRPAIMYPYAMLFANAPEAVIVDALSAQMADFASAFLPEGFELDWPTAYAIAKYGTEKAMTICKGTFAKEIKETIEFVSANLANYNY